MEQAIAAKTDAPNPNFLYLDVTLSSANFLKSHSNIVCITIRNIQNQLANPVAKSEAQNLKL